MLNRLASNPISFRDRRKAFYRAYWEHAADRLGAGIADLGNDYFRIALGKRSTLVNFHCVNLDSHFNKLLVDRKPFISGLIRELGYASPRFMEYTLREIEAAGDFLRDINGPCVVKPTSDSGGRGITTQIRDWKRLVQASLAASRTLSLPVLMIEEQIPGDAYRLLYLDGRLLHAVKRGKCTVQGDGRSDIRRLVGIENVNRLNGRELQALSQLTIDLELKYTLADQGRSLGTVPGAGEAFVVKNVSNQNARRDQAVVTQRVHPAYHELAARVSGQLGAHLFGVDIVTRDIAERPTESNSAVIEINIPPGLHYHELTAGQQGFSEVGASILGYLLKEAEPRSARYGAAVA
jgi:D-alanine-D-alanine ligase-like ATP-grasp enzyme